MIRKKRKYVEVVDEIPLFLRERVVGQRRRQLKKFSEQIWHFSNNHKTQEIWKNLPICKRIFKKKNPGRMKIKNFILLQKCYKQRN